MSSAQRPGIAGWSIDLPDGWFEVPLEASSAAEAGSTAVSAGIDDVEHEWIRAVIDGAREAAVEPGSSTGLGTELRHVRQGLLSRADPWLRAAVSIRPEFEMTIGCLLIGSQAGLDPDDDADAFALLLEEGYRHPGRGIRTHGWRTWRERLDAAEIVGSYQRFETRDPGVEGGRIEDRTFFGIFPDGAMEMIRLEFTVSDLAAFRDIVDETAAIVRTVRFALEGAADEFLGAKAP